MTDRVLLLFSSSSYSDQKPELGRKTIDYKPDDVDIIRYRLGAIYNRNITIDDSIKAYDRVSINDDPNDPRKEVLIIKPYNPQSDNMFSTQADASDTYNQQSTINNWVNSISDNNIEGIPNLLNIIPPEYGSQNSYEDLYFISFPAVDDNIKNSDPNPNLRGASVEVVYNYYDQAYENVMNFGSYTSSSFQENAFQIDEKLMPSYFALSDVIGAPGAAAINPMSKMIFTSITPNAVSSGQKVNLKEVDYFTAYAREIYKLRNQDDPTLNFLSSIQNKIILQASIVDSYFHDSDDILSDLPMYNKISFDLRVDQGQGDPSSIPYFGDLLHLLNQNGLWARFIALNEDIDNVQGSTGTEFNIFADPPGSIPFTPDNLYEGFETTEELKTQSVLPPTDDIINNSNRYIPGYEAASEYVLGTGNSAPLFVQALGGPYLDAMIEVMKGYRKYKSIINGGISPSYTLYYEVQKWSVDAGNNPLELIQTFYVPNAGYSTRANLYDTQIKYGKNYIYRIYACNMVVGTNYHYTLDDVTKPGDQGYSPSLSTNDLRAEICVFSDANPQIVKTPYYQKLVNVSDRPPISPDVSLYPYFGDKNRIKFLLKGNNGEQSQSPIFIRPEDSTIFSNIRRALDLGPNELIPFKSDDPSVKFDIFRLDFRPTSYEDFKFADYTQIETGGFENPYKKAASAALDEFIEPNKKYYYTFRAVDVHGKVSNPSPIYQVEIVYDGASPFLNSKIIDLVPEKVPAQEATKKARKYIRIRPNYDQTLLNERATGIINADGTFNEKWFPNLEADPQNPNNKIILGREQNSLWGNTFKIRITSKKSGKKIDLNVKFTTNKVIIDEKDVNNIS